MTPKSEQFLGMRLTENRLAEPQFFFLMEHYVMLFHPSPALSRSTISTGEIKGDL